MTKVDNNILFKEKENIKHNYSNKIHFDKNVEDISEKKRSLDGFSKNLGIITIITTVLNLILVGVAIFIINNLIQYILSEQSKQMTLQRNIWSSFVDKYSSKIDNYKSDDIKNTMIGNEILPLNVLYNIPLKNLENIDAIILEFEENEGSERKRYEYMYHVESITREVVIDNVKGNRKESILKFNLSDGNILLIMKEKAILNDKSGNKIHEILFLDDFRDNEKLLRKENKNISEVRRLISTDSHKYTATHSLKTQSAYMAAVCKYGCGEMGVTYPYYYRPFFGYGFPLLGTEPYFQSGYGGNVDTAMNNNMFNPESASPRPPGVQGTPQTSPFMMNENPYNYPYSTGPGGGYYYYYYYPQPELPYEENYAYLPINVTENN